MDDISKIFEVRYLIEDPTSDHERYIMDHIGTVFEGRYLIEDLFWTTYGRR